MYRIEFRKGNGVTRTEWRNTVQGDFDRQLITSGVTPSQRRALGEWGRFLRWLAGM